MNIASSFRMKEIDRISIEERGFGDLILMENAGIRILETALKITDFSDKTIVCIAGSGNNGGDALVIARQIFSAKTNPVSVILISESGTSAFNFNLNLCRTLGLRIIEADSLDAVSELQNAGIIFDGIAGTGIRGELRKPAAVMANMINSSAAVCLSIDLPSGTGEQYKSEYPAVSADYTVTVGLAKRSLYLPVTRRLCGEIHIVQPGFPADVLNDEGLEPDGRCWTLAGDDDLNRLMPVLRADDYKNTRGHLGIFAGSPGTTGAASLCAESSIRTSAGLVSLFASDDIYELLASKHMAVMVKPLKAEVVPELSAFSALAVGPGWGTEGRKDLLLSLLENSRGVLDADGINVLASIVAESGVYPDLGLRWVLTPHPGEFKRLYPGIDPIKNPYEASVAASEALNCVILLKGVVSYIAAPDGRSAVVDGAFPRLGTAGSGDLLCGLIGGYAAGGMSLFDAALLGALVHLRAGKRCGRQKEWFSAEDLIQYI